MPGRLKRVLTFREVVIFGIGIIIGAGIYSIIGKAAAAAGSGVWVSVLIAGIITGFTALSFAEMTGMYPKTSSYFRLFKDTSKKIGRAWGFIVEWFLVLAAIFSIATIALAFGGYLSSFFNISILVAAISIIIFAGIITFLGIKESVITTVLFTFVEVTGLIIVIILGLLFAKPNVRILFGFDLNYNIFYAASLIFFAFTGFELIPPQSEETIAPKKLIPKAIIGSILISTVIYMLVAIATVSMFDVELLGASTAPLVDAVISNFGSNAALLVWFSAIIATSSTILGIIIASSRLMYGLGKEKLFPSFFSKVTKRFKTPFVAIAMICSVGIIGIVLIQDLTTTAEIANLLTLLTFYSVNISIVALRWLRPNIRREFKVPLTIKNTPVPSLIGAILCVLIILQFPMNILINGLFITLIGIAFYLLTREKYII
ncbi:MAG: APC family permease [Candidatus Aenigmarchaeota archaeon]|nr:APC family permease [Candidatus Aenigmarchaeota archaeon]